MSERRRKHWGWGFEDQQPSAEQLRASIPELQAALQVEISEPADPVPLEQAQIAPQRVAIPPELADFSDGSPRARASHALGKSYCDVVDGFNGRFEHAPDFVVRVRTEADVERTLEWCAGTGVAVIPYGGGTSVVGGVTPRLAGAHNGAISLDLSELQRVLEVDAVSRSALIEGGALGPSLEQQLHAQGFTLRHFPQSFEYSTLGGWIATRAGGHFATVCTHIDDFVESVRAITPAGAWESRRLPGSGAGVSPDRMLVGSEGSLGVITRAWVRVQPRPEHRASAGVTFPDLARGAECVRAIAQSGLHPSNCRLLDPGEAGLTRAGDGEHAVLVLGFESTDHAVDGSMQRALALCAEHGGSVPEARSGGRDAVGTWRDAFLGAPYLRDSLVALGVLSETFETAITWERFEGFHDAVKGAAEAAVREVCGSGRVSCRFTHVYPNGPAPYFTVIAPARRGEEVEQWRAIKQAASDAIIAAGGTITHHHAVGRDHRPWYDRQRPQLFADALSAAKRALDPQQIMNPGVLVDAQR